MPDIVLATLNAKYIHTAFGLRYLMANLGDLQPRATLLEFDIHQRPIDIVEVILAKNPLVIGLGVYIWNVTPTMEVVIALKQIRPDVKIILGGPEVSFETEEQPLTRLADHIVTGEADLTFAGLCRDLLDADTPAPARIISSPPPDLAQLAFPYDLYTDQDVAHRILYVEASRGCPFTCEFCLSSLDIPVRAVPMEPFLQQLDQLLQRGVRQFKFVDRTFNLNLHTSRALLQFFLERYEPGLFLHFEMIPDRLPAGLREWITRFPAGALQFEVGIQSFNDHVCELISRRQNLERLEDNFRFLREETGVHVHADLIVGLPGESLESFATGFDRLVGLGPQEIQVGILKRLRGTPITRHDQDWGMVYHAHPPYEILQTKLITFNDMQRMRRFARYWDLVANSGNFVESTPLLWDHPNTPRSPFAAFLNWSNWLFAETGRTDAISLPRLVGFLFRYLTEILQKDPEQVADTMGRDYLRPGRRDVPPCLRPHMTAPVVMKQDSARPDTPPRQKRQARHLG